MRTALDLKRVNRALAALALLTALVMAALFAILTQGLPSLATAFSLSTLSVVRFTLVQATLSTLISVLLALPLAFFLDQMRGFPLRSSIIGLFSLPLSMPAIVAVLAILSLLGRNGWVSQAAASLGLALKPDIYGLGGILLAHTFFNLPLAARLLLSALDATPDVHWKLAESLKFRTMDRFRMIAWPAMKAALPGAAGLVFLLCLTSFAIVLILGGGPASTTLEVAVYQSLTFDFDVSRAATLTIVQITLVLAALAVINWMKQPLQQLSVGQSAGRRFASLLLPARVAGSAVILVSALFVAAPFAVIFLDGLKANHVQILTSSSFVSAMGTSLSISVCSAVIATLLGAALVAGRAGAGEGRGVLNSALFVAPNLILAFPPIVLGTGWFIAASRLGNPFAVAIPVIIAANILMALPFVVQLLDPAYRAAVARHDRLCATLRLSGLNRLRLIDFPALRRPLLAAFTFAMALSLGDLGVVALFGSGGTQTLPALLFAKMGAYRSHDAAGIALYLMMISVGLAVLANAFQGERNDR